jgi:hypothetical protein
MAEDLAQPFVYAFAKWTLPVCIGVGSHKALVEFPGTEKGTTSLVHLVRVGLIPLRKLEALTKLGELALKL